MAARVAGFDLFAGLIMRPWTAGVVGSCMLLASSLFRALVARFAVSPTIRMRGRVSESAAAAARDVEHDFRRLGAWRRVKRHDLVEAGEGPDLAPALGRVGEQRHKRIGDALRRAIALQEFRYDVLAEHEI